MIAASCPREIVADDIADELPDGRAGMADPLEVSDHRGQPGPDQTVSKLIPIGSGAV